ncbi:uncharacterized protein LOC126163124 [Schistocerca cancellata]|uniref:uncharacterized protein LOC126163124 n=1 Tax=Schistocerca cancellata TaxID=274614 RepID=UPI002117FFB9|nr:uncharacterized protein LOC126163124 [Schistocerca cancellata]
MYQRSISLLMLLATCFAEFYPLHEIAVHDPKSFDVLYSSTSGPHNETWRFTLPVKLTAVILPSQVFNFSSGGLWPGGTYSENLQVLVYQTGLASDAEDEFTLLVGSGSFNDSVQFGQELRIAVTTANGAAIPVREYETSSNGYSYTFSIIFGSTGFYPWYNSRVLTAYSAVERSTNVAGIALGIAFSDG